MHAALPAECISCAPATHKPLPLPQAPAFCPVPDFNFLLFVAQNPLGQVVAEAKKHKD